MAARNRRHKDIIETDAPALPVPQPRFWPVVRHEPMRRSTRAERMEEMSMLWRDMLVPWNVPTSEMTPEERKRWRR
jgi:hypothetical protein